jgi:signal transduction histidine kinase
MSSRPAVRLTVRTRLTLIFALAFLVGGLVLIALTTSLADRSIARAYSSSAPAAAARDNQINKLLAEAKSKASGSAAPSSKPGQSPTPSGSKTANLDAGSADLKRQLAKANNSFTTTAQSNAVHSLLVESLIAAAILIPAAALLAWWLAGRSLRPVRAITAAAQQASANRLSYRLAMSGPRDEISELAHTYDAMMDRLEHAFDAQRRFVANASHELRTPLAVAGTAVDVTLARPDRRPEQLEAMARDVRGALARAEQLVDSLLSLTRSQNLERATDPVDLATLAEDALDAQAHSIAERSLTVNAELAEARTIGDAALLARLVGNLIDNAVRHNVEGGHLDVRTDRGDAAVVLRVSNTGAVIDPQLVDQLAEPFQRATGRARGSDDGLGLGLAIVQSIADAHGARLTLTAPPTGGLEVFLELPTSSRRADD